MQRLPNTDHFKKVLATGTKAVLTLIVRSIGELLLL